MCDPVAPQTAHIDDQASLAAPAGSWKVITCVLGSSYPNMSSSVEWKLGNTVYCLHQSVNDCFNG